VEVGEMGNRNAGGAPALPGEKTTHDKRLSGGWACPFFPSSCFLACCLLGFPAVEGILSDVYWGRRRERGVEMAFCAFYAFYASLDVEVDQGRGGSNDDMNLPILRDGDWSVKAKVQGAVSRAATQLPVSTQREIRWLEPYPGVLISPCRRAPMKPSIIPTMKEMVFKYFIALVRSLSCV
jgi:hypothetical protein